MMKFYIVCFVTVILLGISLTSYSFGQFVPHERDKTFVFVQSILTNSDGQLITYLASSKFTYLNFAELDLFLERELSPADPVITIGEKDYQLIRRQKVVAVESETVVASTLLMDNQKGESIFLARFAHDGYPAVPGDELKSIWTFLRPVS